MSGWLALPWVGLVLVLAWRRRPAPARVRELRSSIDPSPPQSRGALVERLGCKLRGLAARPPDPALDRRLGWSVVVALALATIEPALSPLGAGVWLAGRWATARRRRRDDERLVDAGPEVVDLFLLTVDAGCNPRLAVSAVASRCVGPWGEALDRVVDRVDHGERLSHALDVLADELGEPARPLVVALLDAEHYGVPLVPALERLVHEQAGERRRRAEERARRVPVQLLFPLVFCTLPAFVLLTIVPLLAGTLPTLSP